MDRRRLLIGMGGAAALAAAGAFGWRAAVGSGDAYATWAAGLRAPLPMEVGDADIVRYATLAANSHNTQAWSFRAGRGWLEIAPDLSRATPAVDPDNHHLFVSLGCAAANLEIASAASGRAGAVEIRDDGSVRHAHAAARSRSDPLLAAIPRRQCSRSRYDGRAVPPADIEALQRAAAIPGVRLIMLTDRAQVGRVRDLAVAGNGAQIADPAFIAELKAWLRFNPRSAIASGDGLYSACTGNPALPDAIGRLAFDAVFTAANENDRLAADIASSAGIAVFVGEREDLVHWVDVGRACQRFALAATTLGLRHAFVNQPVEVAALRPALAELVGTPGLRPDLVLRFGYGPMLPYAPRRPVAEVLA